MQVFNTHHRYTIHLTKRYKPIHQGFDKHDLCLLDAFIVKYDAERQNHLQLHTDASLLSFNILLNDGSEFDGGGTLVHLDKRGCQVFTARLFMY